MASGTGYNPTQAAGWVSKRYSPRFDRLCYESSKLVQRVDEDEALHGQLVISKHDNLTVTTRADGTDIYEPTFTSNTEGTITVSPTYYDCNVAVDDRTIARAVADPNSMLAESAVMALAQQGDINVATQFFSLTTNPLGSFASDLDLPTILAGRAAVLKGAKEYAKIGEIYFAYHTDQDDAVMGIAPLTQWSARGDTGNAAKTGILGEAFGIQFLFTTNIRNSGGGYNNCMFIKRGFVVSYNIRPRTKLQPHGNAQWILGEMDQGVNIKRDQYSALLKSKPS
jgi:hypothetical protein